MSRLDCQWLTDCLTAWLPESWNEHWIRTHICIGRTIQVILKLLENYCGRLNELAHFLAICMSLSLSFSRNSPHISQEINDAPQKRLAPHVDTCPCGLLRVSLIWYSTTSNYLQFYWRPFHQALTQFRLRMVQFFFFSKYLRHIAATETIVSSRSTL